MGQIVELGALELIEMGAARQEKPSGPSPVIDLFEVVNFVENPFAGMEEEGVGPITSRQRSIASRLRNLALMQRRALVNPGILEGLGYLDIAGETNRLASYLNALSGEDVLGKSFKKKLKAVGKKVVKVVKSPAFLSVAGLAANLIPGVGPVVSGALTATAGIMAKKQQEAEQKRQVKKAAQAAAFEAQAEQGRQLDAYYAQYASSHFIPLGYTADVWAKLTVEQKLDAAQKLSEGKLEPYVSPAQSEVARAAALSLAVKDTYGNQLPGQGVDLSSLPPPVAEQARALAPQYQQQIQAVGQDNFLAAAMKAVGQGSAISEFFSGAGASLPGGLSDIFGKIEGEAKKAGERDLLNAGAAAGVTEDVKNLIEKGTSTSPWVYVGVAAAGVVAVGTAIVLATRG